ncbi:MAG: ATP-dependent Clp protease adaptor ClpS [Bacteroidales bacterium]|jgi:ATP-dependent Clp protease adaptor protein ClpS|nr:ATP-dependent Clp protease adaptor ClpS [Bacteroidales bacterium]MDD4002477.1 ATP-dependent Clp protease adaptor ClpS [Bacteroidales bacterium]MDD4529917.1 ATP-dependent Clp protease adaptor ClpS [Bacteroidales bacterium]MDD4829814.1 ATP-dependent Clp protease adaptor ClpS [Bacteroidales bacterium]
MGDPYNETNPEQVECISSIDEEGNELILFNDNVHTFDYVIDCLVEICKLSYEQASNCANIVDRKGLCAVKHGSYDELLIMHNQLVKKKLKVEIR